MNNSIVNPLLHPIREILAGAGQLLSEHELIKRLKNRDSTFPALTESARLALFQTHFLVMNALYQLQQQMADECLVLQISPLAIGFKVSAGDVATKLLTDATAPAMKAYYLNMDNFHATDEQDVERLFKQFWQSYLSEDKQLDAYQVLGLAPGAEWSEVQQAYRLLASTYHPDRGGDVSQFMLVREAYEVLSSTKS